MTTVIEHSERADEFQEKLFNNKFKAVEHKIVIRAVEFVPMEEFQEKSIKADSYEEELKSYIKEKVFDMQDFLKSSKKSLDEKGLFVEQVKSRIKPYSPLNQLFEIIKSSNPAEGLEKLLGITPPPTE